MNEKSEHSTLRVAAVRLTSITSGTLHGIWCNIAFSSSFEALGGLPPALTKKTRTMIIRRARPEEAEVLTQLALRSKRSWGYDDTFMSAIANDMIVRSDYLKNEYAVVAQRDDGIAGYAILRLDGGQAYLRDLFVDPLFMRKGVGAALFDHMLVFAKNQGAKRLALVSDPNAVGFYRRYGLRLIAQEASTFVVGRKLPVMAIHLPGSGATASLGAPSSKVPW